MAGPPTGSPRPGSVTRPTPSPCRKWMPGSSLKATVATIACPFVTSGSSPASLMTTASAARWRATGIESISLSGNKTSTLSPIGLPSRESSAAFEAAVAQAPVVKPLRNGKKPGTSRSMALRKPCSPVTISKPAGRAGRRTTYTGIPAACAASTFCEKPPDSPLSLVRMACGRKRAISVASSSSS